MRKLELQETIAQNQKIVLCRQGFPFDDTSIFFPCGRFRGPGLLDLKSGYLGTHPTCKEPSNITLTQKFVLSRETFKNLSLQILQLNFFMWPVSSYTIFRQAHRKVKLLIGKKVVKERSPFVKKL